VPNFFGQKDLGVERGGTVEAGVTPADELVVFDDFLEVIGVQDENVAEAGAG
jgi:hypothetical protein